jgi:hypothetical protein
MDGADGGIRGRGGSFMHIAGKGGQVFARFRAKDFKERARNLPVAKNDPGRKGCW